MAYTSASAADRLARVREAIDEVLTAQSYTVRGRIFQGARLKELREMEKELIQEVDAANNAGSMTSLGVMVPPT